MHGSSALNIPVTPASEEVSGAALNSDSHQLNETSGHPRDLSSGPTSFQATPIDGLEPVDSFREPPEPQEWSHDIPSSHHQML